MSTRNIAITLPVDKDGFLRRECPSCKRQFKWLPLKAKQVSNPNHSIIAHTVENQPQLTLGGPENSVNT